MIDRIQKRWDKDPLILIMGSAIIFRLLSVIFAKGWGMIDDHFIVIESAQSWVDGKDYNYWLPWSSGRGPTGHNFFYPGVHYLLFLFFKFIHLNDPQAKMYVVRFLHGAWSLLTVYFGYKITERLDDKKSARLAGLLLAVLWFMPWMSVHNLVEMTCIPFIILAVWFIVSRGGSSGQQAAYFLAGLFLGFAFNLRPQTVFFSIGLGLVFLIGKNWKETISYILGFLIPLVLIQGTIDFFIWGTPFVEIITYFKINLRDSESYITLPWYNYFLVLFGVLIPPVSFFLFTGFIRNWRKILVMFVPVTLFFIMHSIFPNKQERFILPILPFIVISGVIGWNDLVSRSGFWKRRPGLLKSCWVFFWTVNIVMLLVVSTIYSKRARAESMYYLSRYPEINYLLVADEGDSPELFPRFYLGQWPDVYEEFIGNENTEMLMKRVAGKSPQKQPRFILFTGETNRSGQVQNARKYFPFIVYETTIEPGLIDKITYWLNPEHNKNRTVYIYRNTLFYPRKIQ